MLKNNLNLFNQEGGNYTKKEYFNKFVRFIDDQQLHYILSINNNNVRIKNVREGYETDTTFDKLNLWITRSFNVN